ncbi:hypothetical protein ACH5RR_015755, partial [Cinchona calisaya]
WGSTKYGSFSVGKKICLAPPALESTPTFATKSSGTVKAGRDPSPFSSVGIGSDSKAVKEICPIDLALMAYVHYNKLVTACHHHERIAFRLDDNVTFRMQAGKGPNQLGNERSDDVIRELEPKVRLGGSGDSAD